MKLCQRFFRASPPLHYWREIILVPFATIPPLFIFAKISAEKARE